MIRLPIHLFSFFLFQPYSCVFFSSFAQLTVYLIDEIAYINNLNLFMGSCLLAWPFVLLDSLSLLAPFKAFFKLLIQSTCVKSSLRSTLYTASGRFTLHTRFHTLTAEKLNTMLNLNIQIHTILNLLLTFNLIAIYLINSIYAITFMFITTTAALATIVTTCTICCECRK